MKKEFEVCKYKNEWAIYGKKSACYLLFGTKKEVTATCKRLNAMEDQK